MDFEEGETTRDISESRLRGAFRREAKCGNCSGEEVNARPVESAGSRVGGRGVFLCRGDDRMKLEAGESGEGFSEKGAEACVETKCEAALTFVLGRQAGLLRKSETQLDVWL